MKNSTLLALAPVPEPFDPEWSQTTLADIVSAERSTPARQHKNRRRVLIGLAAGLVTVSTATAVAVGGPSDAVKRVILDFGKQPNTSANGLGELQDPQLVAKFPMQTGLFSLWVATSSTGKVCFAYSDGQWNGEGNPTKDQLEYGCGGEIYVGPDQPPEELTRPDQIGGFFKDEGPVVYGISPYPDAATVRVQGTGVDRTLPVRPDSHGYGAALPEADHASEVTLTFLDADGRVLGSTRSIAPVG